MVQHVNLQKENHKIKQRINVVCAEIASNPSTPTMHIYIHVHIPQGKKKD